MPAAPRGLFGLLRSPAHSLRLPTPIRETLFAAPSQVAPKCCRQYVKPTSTLRAAARPAPSVRSYMASDPAIRTVLRQKAPLELYRQPENRWHIAKIYALGLGVGLTGLYCGKFYYEVRERDGLAFFVAPTYIVLAFGMVALSTWILQRPVSPCTSIELIPSKFGNASVQLRIRAKPFPFAKETVTVANLGEASIHEKLLPVKEELAEATRARTQSITVDTEDMSIVKRMSVIAGRWIDQKWTSFFLKFKFAVLQFNIVKMNVKGETWKIDCTGYMLENGKAIDRLIAVGDD